MKTWIRLALRHIFAGKPWSAVMFSIFLLAAFILYWAFGFSNKAVVLLEDALRSSYGDGAFLIEWTDEAALREITREFSSSAEFYFEREIGAVVSDDRKAVTLSIVERTVANSQALNLYIAAVEGRLPERDDELAVTRYIGNGLFRIGDTVRIETIVPEKGTVKKEYRVVGISMSTALKAIGIGYLVGSDGMTRLMENETLRNIVYYRERDGEPARRLQPRIRTALETRSVRIIEDWTLEEKNARFALFTKVFLVTRYLLMGVIFPVIGIILAFFCWYDVHRTREQIRMMFCLGVFEREVLAVYLLRFMMLGIAGCLAGFLAGYGLEALARYRNVWLVLSYTISSPLLLSVTPGNILLILVFFTAEILLWVGVPLRLMFGRFSNAGSGRDIL